MKRIGIDVRELEYGKITGIGRTILNFLSCISSASKHQIVSDEVIEKMAFSPIFQDYNRTIRLSYFVPSVFIEPTNVCNFKCAYCPQYGGLNTPNGFIVAIAWLYREKFDGTFIIKTTKT